jgi:hypothetical protein
VKYLTQYLKDQGISVVKATLNLSTTQWPAVALPAQAMAKAGTVTDTGKINDALQQVSLTNDPGFPGKTLRFDTSHVMQYPQTVGTVVDGQGHAQVGVAAA